MQMDNMNQEQLDKEIARMKLEYEIDALNSQVKQERQKMLQSQKAMNSAKSKIEELTARIADAKLMLEMT